MIFTHLSPLNLIASNQNKCDQCSIDSSRNSTFSEDYNPASNAHVADDEADAGIRRPQVEVQTVYCTYIKESDDDWPNAKVSGRRGDPQACTCLISAWCFCHVWGML